VAVGEPLALLLDAALGNRELRSRLKEQRFQVNFRGVELEALYDVGLAIASTLDLEQLSEEILLRAVSLLDARRGALYLCEDGVLRRHRTFGGDARESFTPVAEAGSGDEPGRLQVPTDLLPGVRHLLALPIEIDGDLRGVLAVGDRESRSGIGPFAERDRRTLSLFANQAAIALENARLHRQALEKQRLEREMELAAEIQRQILPKGSPLVAGYDLAGWSRPARQVGGDYYDLLVLADGRLRIALGDVSGKGVPAALLVSTLHSALRLLGGEDGLTGDLVARVSRHVADSSAPNRFITLVVAELDLSTGRLRYVSAGHNPAILVRAGGAVEQLSSSGLPVGMLPRAEYDVREARLAPGDLLCLYSDGITEAARGNGEEFGVERLEELLARHHGKALDELTTEIGGTIARFSAGQPQGDDETLVLLRRQR
jgi:sigma-B regulation protein RsbU (phosphoserine phosphatase)